MLTAAVVTTVLGALVRYGWKWISEDGPVRLTAGLAAVLHKDPVRRRDARRVLELTEHTRGPVLGADRRRSLARAPRGQKRARRGPGPAESAGAA